MKKNRVVVVIITHKEELSSYELISFKQCLKIFGKYPIRIVCPAGLNTSCYSPISPSQFDFIRPAWLNSLRAFNRLMINPFLYKKYSQFEYILFYELDAFVFRDDLEMWCERGFDYIGAPWFEGFNPVVSERMIGVGNSGFSLRRVESHLKALHTFSLIYRPNELVSGFQAMPIKRKIRNSLRFATSFLGIGNNSFHTINNFMGNQDVFWGIYIKRNFSWFNVAKPEDAIPFSFEVNPRLLFQWNKNQLPFGCHGWYKIDFDFWKPHIQNQGYNLR